MRTGESDHRFHVLILGGGTAGWMTAAGLVRRLPADAYRVSLVESEEIGTVSVGEATLPHIKQFNDVLGLDEADFMAATRATFKLGIEFVDWDRPGDAYIHPFGAFGEPWGGVEFQHHWHRLRTAGRLVAPFQAYSYAVAAARADVFELPSEDPSSISSTYSYAYHFDSGRYAEYLRAWSTAHGVARVEGQVAAVERDGGTGVIRALVMKSGVQMSADLFVDCSGFRSLLLGDALGVGWEDWHDWLPCDRALAVACEHSQASALTPYTRTTARAGGWQWRIPLQHRIGNGYVFSSDFLTQDAAHDVLLRHLDGPPQDAPRLLRFAPGRRTCAWKSNCIAIGLASGFLEPLESTSIFLVQAAVSDLVDLLPRRRLPDPRLADEFNRLTAMHYERIRDFLVLHYAANRRQGEPLWDYLRTMPLPDSLVHKLALFRARGSAPDYQFGLFSRDSWLAVLYGQGLMPRAHDPIADTFDLELVDTRCREFAGRIESGVALMRPHRDFVASYCPATEMVTA